MQKTLLVVVALIALAPMAFADVLISNPGVDVAWTSTADAGWGTVATRSNPAAGGQSGAFFQMARSGGGSSMNALQVAVNPGTTGNVSGYMTVSAGGDLWAELGAKSGNFDANDFDANGGTWTLIKKYDNAGSAGWEFWSASVSIGALDTQLSIGVKLGSGGASPTAGWDEINIEAPLETDSWMLY